jgi:flavorubredoxin/NADPH-dependent 2,4-dienoyl-CoA reductase/sulfur reductase-like enzyme
MREVKITDSVSWIGAVDHDLRVFDIIMYTEFGTSYNSYFIEGSEKQVIVETVKHTFTDEYIEFLKANKDLEAIDYILVNHTEPDHVGTVAKLLEYTPNAEVIGSAAAIRFLKEIANKPFNSIVAKEGMEISLGDKTLQFINAPFLHWPDSIYTYVPEDKLLFTCDSFGAHYALDEVFYSKIPNMDHYKKALKYYFDMIFGPFKQHMLNAIAKIEPLAIDYICNGHGPVLDQNPKEIVEICKTWSTVQVSKPTIVIPYVSAYGYTRTLAEAIAKGVQSEGQFEVQMFDIVYADETEVMNAITSAEGILFGSPTINGDALLPIMNLLIKMSPIVHGGKLAAAFGSFGWSGEAVENLSTRMKALKLRVLEGFRVNFKPTEEDLENAIQFGRDFVKVATKEEVFIPFDTPHNLTHDIEDDGEKPIKKWICVICGEVFEGVEPPEICAACGADKDQFEEYIEMTHEMEAELHEHIVIVGNGISGVTCAETIRKYSEDAKITIIDRSEHPVYYKPMVSKFIGQETMPDAFFLHDHHWYEHHNIHFMSPEHLKSINPDEKMVLLDSGKQVSYDKLVIATGSDSFMPPIRNKDLEGVYTLRTYDNALVIKEKMKVSKKAVVIGGGLLGLEAAAQLHHGGLDVTVVEIMDRILPRQLDAKGATLLEDSFSHAEIGIVKGIGVESIVGKDKVEGVQLVDGRLIEADLVIISAGVRSDLKPFEAIGMKTGRGIIVNERMETSVQDIFACGDVACFEDNNYSIWPEALQQGETVGLTILGVEKTYETFIPSTIFNALDINIFSIGVVNINEEDNSYSKVVYENPEHHKYVLLNFKEEQLIGGVLIGNNKKSKLLIDGIRNKSKLAELVGVFQ